jgi:4-diphosphocytidyl-2-C-methyl-D-erythritol kinase
VPVTVQAPAKLTTRLHLVGLRNDGYHLIDAEMVTLDLADTLTIDPDGDGLSADGPFAAGMPLDATNLVAKALRAVGRTAHVHVRKVIPHGGGLGGGSADAAAILRWSGCDDVAVAAGLGADVPFCLVGGRARVTGIGEVLTPLPPQQRVFTLVIPPLAVSTPAAYRAWDELGGPRSGGANDLEAGALAVEPLLARYRDRIHELTGAAVTLAGSGATWFVEGRYGDVLASMDDCAVREVTTRSA